MNTTRYMTFHLPFRFALIFASILSGIELAAQEPGMIVYGTVRDMVTGDSIPNSTVTLIGDENDIPLITIATSARGRFEIGLNEMKPYTILYSAPGKVGKKVLIDLRGPSKEILEVGIWMHIDVTLLDSLPDVDFSVLAEPFGKAHYNAASKNYEWDMEYVSSMRDRQAALLKAYQERTGIPRPKE
jgi:hypothetical protein